MSLQSITNLNENEKNLTIEEKIVIYLRVSAEEQKRSGQGIIGQENSCRKFIKEKFPNAEIVCVYSDEGVSSTKYLLNERKQISQMLVDAKKGKFNIIVTFNQDRLARRGAELEYICKLTELNEVRIYLSATNALLNNATPQTQLTRNIQSAISTYEVEQTRMRVLATKEGQRELGRFSGGDIPYGFKWNKEEQKVIEIEEEIRVWLDIILKYLYENKGCVLIARELNEQNIPYRTGNKKSGGENATKTWSSDNVLALLKNPMLTGRFATKVVDRWIDENGKRHAKRRKPSDYDLQETHLLREIIPLDVWKDIIKKLEDKNENKAPTRQMTTNFLLGGILKCECGSHMRTYSTTNKQKKKYYYYKCKNTNCTSLYKSIKKEDVEKYVLNEMKNRLSLKNVSENIIVKMTNEIMEESHNHADNTIELLKSRLELAVGNLDRIKNDYSKGVLPVEDYLEFKEPLEKEIQQTKEELSLKEVEEKTRAEQQEEIADLFKSIEMFDKTFHDDASANDDFLNTRKRSLILNFLDTVEIVNGEYNILYRYETKNVVPSHLKRVLDEDMAKAWTEIMNGERELGASNEVLGSKLLPRRVSHLISLHENPAYIKVMTMLSELNGIKPKKTSNLYTARVSKQKEIIGA
jgi:site-specific DNA recombinase